METDTATGLEVVRVLNNNAVLATDRVGGQAILLGRGLGFGKHLGDEIDPGAASQVFVPDSGLPRSSGHGKAFGSTTRCAGR